MAASSAAPARSKASVISPLSPLASTLAASAPNSMRSPTRSFLAGRASARQCDRRKPLDQRRLYVGFRVAARAKPIEARANDSRVVDDQRVAGPQQLGEVRYMEIIESRGARGYDEHARAVARARRTQGDRLGRKLEIKKIDAHL